MQYTSTSIDSVPYMGEDLWFKILKSLPVKDIIRCTCVCKALYTLVSSSAFIKEHLDWKLEKGRNGDNLLMFRHGCTSLDAAAWVGEQAKFSLLKAKSLSSVCESFYCPLLPVNSCYLRVVGSVHGMICLIDEVDNSFPASKDVTLVWNPSVCRYVCLPEPPSEFEPYRSDNSKCFQLCFPRFTFDPVNKEYLIVRVAYSYRNGLSIAAPPVVEFYSLFGGEREWKTVPKAGDVLAPRRKTRRLAARILEPYIIVEDSCSQYSSCVDGTVCWIAWRKPSSTLVLFSAVDRELKTLALPLELGRRLCPVRSRVVDFRGLLSVMQVPVSSPATTPNLAFNIWSWFADQDQWSKMVSFEKHHGIALNRIFQVTDGQHVIGSRDRDLVLFNPQTNQIYNRLGEHGDDGRALHLTSYMQTLLLLDEDIGSISYDPSTIPRQDPFQKRGPCESELLVWHLYKAARSRKYCL